MHFGQDCQSEHPRRTGHGRSLQTAGHRRILRDSSASGLSSTRPVGSQMSNHDNRVFTSDFLNPTMNVPSGRGSRPTRWPMSDSTCFPRDIGIPPCLRTIPGCWRLRPWRAAASSEGQKREARRGSSSRTSPSSCYSCSLEDSSARGRHSTPPEGQEEEPTTRRSKYFCFFMLCLLKWVLLFI